LFHGLDASDARGIATAWVTNGVAPKIASSYDPAQLIEDLTSKLAASAQTLFEGQQATLFGAILDVRYGARLAGRVEDLVRKFSLINIRPNIEVNLGDIFGGIALLQDTLDRSGGLGTGASRPVIAAMVSLEGVFADGKILELLGREAAITYAGNRVYTRHPSIARATVDYLRAAGRLANIAFLLGKAGGLLRDGSGLEPALYRNAYLLGQDLKMREEAVAAATGAVQGARELLEPRVTLTSVKRRFDSAEAAKYAAGVGAHVREFRDYRASIRGYLVEYSVVARDEGEPYFAMGLAALALDDSTGFNLDRQRASYALTSVAKAAIEVRKQNKLVANNVAEAAFLLLTAVGGESEANRYLSHARSHMPNLEEMKKLGMAALCAKLGPSLNPAIRTAIESIGLSVEFSNTLRLTDLRRLAEH
jgi:hypothetical protein